jgi:arsenate reductase-like glutaredoxin family protein
MNNKRHLSLATDDRQIVLIYNSAEKNHREIRAYAEAAQKPVLDIDIQKTQIGKTVWTEIADLLNCNVEEIIDTNHNSFTSKHGTDVKLESHDALDMLQKDPDMLTYPIMVWGDYAKIVKLYGNAVEFFNRDTSGVRIP